ncbi:MAG TPA: hypothetical protein VGP63_10630 [Planctomycetaceae bacterium]|jgi:hypothetical protein|nr:hypothetical protein [Planctomycetaceae bacterium]
MPDSKVSPTRTVLKWTAALGIFAVLAVLVSGLFLRSRGPSVPDVEPFDVDAFVGKPVPAEKNAANFYREAMPRFVDVKTLLRKGPPQEEAFEKSRDQAVESDWKFANEDVRHWLDANRPAIEIWKRGTQLDESRDIPPNLVDIYTDVSLTTAARTFVSLALLEAAQLNAQGHVDEAWGWYRSALRSSRHIGMHAGAIWRMVGCAMLANATDPVIAWSARPEVTATQLRKALDDLRAIDAMTPPPSDCLKAEYLLTKNSLDGVEAGLGGVATVLNALGAHEHSRRSLRWIFANWLSQADRPRFQRTPIHPGKPEVYELDSSAPPGSPSAAEIQNQFGGSSFRVDLRLAELFLPAGFAVMDSTDREQARRAALILALALQLYAREHGELPADLSALVAAGYLKEIPADPFGKGEPFHYRRGANPGEGTLLWSVWVDGVDQGGKAIAETAPEQSPGDKCFPIKVPSGQQHSVPPASPSSKNRSAKF